MPVEIIAPAELDYLRSVYRISMDAVSTGHETPVTVTFDRKDSELLET